MTIEQIQLALIKNGYKLPKYGPDGNFGNETKAALKAFLAAQNLPAPADPVLKSVIEMLLTKDLAVISGTPGHRERLTESQIIAKFGQPGPTNLAIIDLPYTMVIDWDRAKVTNKIQCHKLIADRLRGALSDLLTHYGIQRIKELELNLYGGCYAFRKERGGSKWSRHAWGIAIDINPSKNTMDMTRNTAQFYRPEYAALHQIFYKHGFLNLGLEKNFDFMHFEICE